MRRFVLMLSILAFCQITFADVYDDYRRKNINDSISKLETNYRDAVGYKEVGATEEIKLLGSQMEDILNSAKANCDPSVSSSECERKLLTHQDEAKETLRKLKKALGIKTSETLPPATRVRRAGAQIEKPVARAPELSSETLKRLDELKKLDPQVMKIQGPNGDVAESIKMAYKMCDEGRELTCSLATKAALSKAINLIRSSENR